MDYVLEQLKKKYPNGLEAMAKEHPHEGILIGPGDPSDCVSIEGDVNCGLYSCAKNEDLQFGDLYIRHDEKGNIISYSGEWPCAKCAIIGEGYRSVKKIKSQKTLLLKKYIEKYIKSLKLSDEYEYDELSEEIKRIVTEAINEEKLLAY